MKPLPISPLSITKIFCNFFNWYYYPSSSLYLFKFIKLS